MKNQSNFTFYSNNSNINTANNNERNTAMNNRYFDNSLDINNPAPRCPVILLLDVSGSMSGTPIEELNHGYNQFLNETMKDEAASMSVELEVITFGNTAKVDQPFCSIYNIKQNSNTFTAGGMTAMGHALELASEHLNERRKKYRDNGIAAYRPWVILMTDGQPNDSWEQPAAEIRSLAEKGQINYLGVAIGNNVDMNTLSRIVPNPLPLKGVRFKQFFRWLTDSLGAVSTTAVSDQDNVQFGDISSWADLKNI